MKKTPQFMVFLLLLIIFPVYSNTLDSTWQFDDNANIVNNTSLHINELTSTRLWKASFSRDGHYNYRPFPNLSFAINWYFGGADTTGYHIVNISIHVLSAFFLFLVCLAIFESPNLKGKCSEKDIYFISFLATVLWALNPIHTQAVTYIVQRMTIMAGMFYVAAIYFYVNARNPVSASHNPGHIDTAENSHSKIYPDYTRKPVFNYSMCLVMYFCAFFSKENAAIIPLSIIVVEAVFFRDLSKIKINWKHLSLILLIYVLTVSAGILVFKNGDFLFFLDGYKNRPFSLWERLLTESRIVLYYISQIFYPLPERLSITHDIVISKNLFQPWTTLPAILAICTTVFFALYKIQKYPLLSFAILFYFLNHIIESTIIPLELVFEHRNYLPSMFLFLPIAWSINEIMKKFRDKNRAVYLVIITTVTLVIIWSGINTYTRNSVWKTELSLWYDAFKKAPEDLRSANNLATSLAWRDNVTQRDIDTAIVILEKALLLNNLVRTEVHRELYGNLGILYLRKYQFEKSIEFHKKSLEIDPDFIKGRFDLVKPLIMSGRWEEASDEMDKLLNNRKGYLKSDYFNVKGFILLWMNRPDEAIPYFRKALSMSPWDPVIYLNIGRALSMAGHYRNAEWFLLRLVNKEPSNILASFCLIENSIKAGKMISAEKDAERLLSSNTIVSINATLNSLSHFYKSVPVSADMIQPVITKKILELSGHADKKQVIIAD